MSNEESVSTRLYRACLQLDSLDPEIANEAYKELYSYIHRAAYRYYEKYYSTTDPYIVEEIVLESLMLVKTKLDQLREPPAFVGFVVGKIQHAAKTVARKFDLKKVNTEVSEDSLSTMESQDERENPIVHAKMNEESDIIQEALDRLPDERMGDIIRLRYNEGRKFKEIAELLEISESNAKVLFNRAKKKLREDKILAEYFKNDYPTDENK